MGVESAGDTFTLAATQSMPQLTEFVIGGVEALYLGAARQEVGGDALHAVLAHVNNFHLRQTQRST